MKEESKILKEINSTQTLAVSMAIITMIFVLLMYTWGSKEHQEIKQLLIEHIQADSLKAVKNLEL